MKIYIYDIEVFSDDWIVVFRNPEHENNHIVIHNDNHHLREFISQPDIILGGFNNKHYDDYVLLTMINGGSNLEVKRCNDWIIQEGKEPWTFPFNQYKKKPFKSFDLKDDIPDPGISLKAIEGNLGLPIVESSVPFDIDRPLTKDELDEVVRYCKNDVDATIRLYQERKENYIDAKALISDMYGLDKAEGIGLTNAKLCARILGAKPQHLTDERDYVIPPNIDTNKIPKPILDFFLQIRDKSIPDAKLFGAGKGSKGMTLDVIFKTSAGECPTTFAWGGVHGAKPCITIEETEDRVIINQDVASLYPNSMLNFGYCSRAMEDPEAYRKLVEKRLYYKAKAKPYWKKITKKLGDDWYKKYETIMFSWRYFLDDIRKDVDEETFNDILAYIEADSRQSSIKLPINTTYGAMLNAHNDLADRWAGRSVCISNQLAMTMLIVDLGHACETIDFVNINTDGIMFTIDKREVDLSEKIVAEWCKVTNFEMERDDFVKVIQKDVNNYIGIKADGSIKTKGGYVSLYKGGNFKTNSLSIIHKAIVDYLVDKTPVETTLDACTDVLQFQQIVKTGGTYEGSYQYIKDERVPIQKVNRIYAVKDKKYGKVVKGKWITEKRKKDKTTGKMISEPVDPPQWSESIIPECPDHAFIDNENILTIDKLDKSYYIEMAKNRIDKYINVDRKVANKLAKIEEVINIMATKTETKPNNVWSKLALARLRFLEAGVKKSGINRYAEYKYFELEDIVPTATKIFNDLGLVFLVAFTENNAIGTLVNTENVNECITFSSPMVELLAWTKQGELKSPAGMNTVQALGSSETYQRRYLYMMCLDIVEADAFDATQGKPSADAPKVEAPKNNTPVTPEKREEVKKELINEDGKATDTQIKSIKNGLKKLRDKDSKYEGYVTEVVKKIKGGLNKSDAENILIEIGKKIEE